MWVRVGVQELLIGLTRVAMNHAVSRVGVEVVATLVTMWYQSLSIGVVCCQDFFTRYISELRFSLWNGLMEVPIQNPVQHMQPQSNFVDLFTLQLWTISNCNSNKVTWNTWNFISSTFKPLYASSRPQHSILIKFQLVKHTQEEILRQYIAPVLTQHHF